MKNTFFISLFLLIFITPSFSQENDNETLTLDSVVEVIVDTNIASRNTRGSITGGGAAGGSPAVVSYSRANFDDSKNQPYHKYDSLRNNITVPEIDPRQYIVIYEWEEANENRIIKGQKEKHFYKKRIADLDYSIKMLEGEKNDKLKERLTKQKKVLEKEKKKAINKKKPFNYLDSIGTSNHEKIETYKDYYNNLFWKNGGTPNWEPIWWLNQYPWASMDYRNLDLKDPDQSEANFALIPFQKYKVIDYQSTLRLVFDKNQMAKNENFKGSISVEAFLYDGAKSNADPREIEVNPYSVIGEERKTIGLMNKPANEISSYLVQMVGKGNSYKQIIASLKRQLSFLIINTEFGYRNIDIEESKQLNKLITHLGAKGSIPDSSNLFVIKELNKGLSKITTDPWYGNKYNIDTVYMDLLINSEDFVNYRNELDRYILNINKTDKATKQTRLKTGKEDFNTLKSTYISLNNDMKLLSKIINYIGTSEGKDGKTQEAFLGLLGQDKITFDHYTLGLKSASSNIEKQLAKWNTDDTSIVNKLSLLKDVQRTINEIEVNLKAIVEIKGSVFHEILLTLGYNDQLKKNSSINTIALPDPPSRFNFNWDASFREIESNMLTSDPTKLNLVRDYLAEKAGEILYQELLYATIDLNLADAQPGDQLIISMIWNKEDQKTDSTNTKQATSKDGVALYLAKFDLKKTGWNFNTSDNALLVKRFNEDILPTDYPLNPTNFSLTGGASMTWSYNNDHRVKTRVKTYKGTNIPKFNWKGKLKTNKAEIAAQRVFKWLEPSVGFNISYLDYRTDESFELGVGPSVGLFNNLIYVTGGWNLMERDQQSPYIGIGFSFINLGTKVNEIINK